MDLQALIKSQLPNGRLELPPGEFFGHVVIDRPLTVVGKGKSTWIGSKTAPTIRITAAGVKLQNFMVEVTTGSDGVAIEADPGTNPTLEDVIVWGLVKGVRKADIYDSRHTRRLPEWPGPFKTPDDGNPGINMPPQQTRVAAYRPLMFLTFILLLIGVLIFLGYLDRQRPQRQVISPAEFVTPVRLAEKGTTKVTRLKEPAQSSQKDSTKKDVHSSDFYADGDPDETVVDIDTKEERFSSYLLHVKGKIQAVWIYPAVASRAGISGKLTLEFLISRDGNVLGVNLLDSSGHTILDESAVRAIKNAAPFFPFPERLTAKRMRIRANFIYIEKSSTGGPVTRSSDGPRPWTDYDTSHILREKTRWLPPFDRPGLEKSVGGSTHRTEPKP